MKKILSVICAIVLGFSAIAQEEFYRFTVMDQDGKNVEMSQYKGQVILIVNTATKCGFTPQYTELQSLYEKYKGKGFVVLDFPCNQFGEQAPGSSQEIHNFCTAEFHITFPQFEKIDVNGDAAIPLYIWLKEQRGFEGFDLNNPIGAYLHKAMKKADPNYMENPDIKWNFTKFLIDREGNVVARYEPTADINEITNMVEKLLKK